MPLPHLGFSSTRAGGRRDWRGEGWQTEEPNKVAQKHSYTCCSTEAHAPLRSQVSFVRQGGGDAAQIYHHVSLLFHQRDW